MHGGDIYSNKIEYDFSVNLNPFGPYPVVMDAVRNAVENINTYPQYDSKELRIRLSEALLVNENCIALTAGASEGLLAVLAALNPEEVVIESPSFSGYGYAVKAQDNIKAIYKSRQELLEIKRDCGFIQKSSAVFLANPANPTGKGNLKQQILDMYKIIREKEAYLILDECFLPLSDYEGESFIREIRENQEFYSNIIVVRSFTKSFSIPGIRLGYLVSGNEELIEKIKRKLPEWNLSVLAQKAGLACLELIENLKNDNKKIRIEREYLEKELSRLRLNYLKSSSCFIVFEAPADLYEKLISKGILIRDCSDYDGIEGLFQNEIICKEDGACQREGITEIHGQELREEENWNPHESQGLKRKFYRIAVKNHEENEKLVEILEKILK